MKELSFHQLAEAFRTYADHVVESPRQVVEALEQYEWDDPDLPRKVGEVLERVEGPGEAGR